MALPQIMIGDDLLGEGLLASVEVVQRLNEHWWSTIVFRNTSDQRIAVEGFLGQSVQIKTQDDTGTEQLHFSGFIQDVRLRYEVWGSYTATVVAVSFSYLFDVTSRKQYYAAKTLASVTSIMAGRDSVPHRGQRRRYQALDYVQYGETDFSFLHRIVDDHAAWFRPNEKGVEVFDSFQSGTTLSWPSGKRPHRLRNPRRSPPPASFSGAHYDHHSMSSTTFRQRLKPAEFYPAAQRLTGAVQTGSQQLPAGFEPQRARAMTLDDYSTQLQAESERSIGAAVTATGQSSDQSCTPATPSRSTVPSMPTAPTALPASRTSGPPPVTPTPSTAPPGKTTATPSHPPPAPGTASSRPRHRAQRP